MSDPVSRLNAALEGRYAIERELGEGSMPPLASPSSSRPPPFNDLWRFDRTKCLPLGQTGAVLLVSLLTGCFGPDDSPTLPLDPPRPTTVDLSISPTLDTLFSAGDTTRLTAIPEDRNGNAVPDLKVTWTSSDSAVVVVDSSGLATAAGPNGDATVTATVDGYEGQTMIAVVTGPQGGTVIAAEGGVRLEVPAGAVPEALKITADPVAIPAVSEHFVEGAVFDLGPDGTQFANPVQLTIRYDPAHIPAGVSEASLVLNQFADGVWIKTEGSTVDVQATTVTAPVTHFSRFGVARAAVSVTIPWDPRGPGGDAIQNATYFKTYDHLGQRIHVYYGDLLTTSATVVERTVECRPFILGNPATDSARWGRCWGVPFSHRLDRIVIIGFTGIPRTQPAPAPCRGGMINATSERHAWIHVYQFASNQPPGPAREEEAHCWGAQLDHLGLTDIQEALDYVRIFLSGCPVGPSPPRPANAGGQLKEGAQAPGPCVVPPPPPPCNSCGDVHVRTPDGLHYDFQGAGEYVLVSSSDGEVVVQTRQEPWRGSNFLSVNTAVAMQVSGDRVGVYVDRSPDLYINGESTSLEAGALDLPNGGTVYRSDGSSGRQYLVEWPNGFVVSAKVHSSHMNVGVAKPATLPTAFSGILGNLNGIAEDDFFTRDGTVLPLRIDFETLYGAFDDGWRIDQGEALFDYEPGMSTATFTLLGFPRGPFTARDLDPADYEAARLICEAAGITDPILLEDCILDVAGTGDTEFTESGVDSAPPEVALEVDPPKDPALVLYYPFDGDALDYSGTGNDGTVFGATLGADRFGNPGKAFHFDGDDFVKADGSVLPSAERTVALWFNAEAVTNHPVLLGYGSGCGTTWYLGLNAGDSRYTNQYYVGPHCQGPLIGYTYASPPVGSWHHFAITTSSTGTRMYVDGVEVASNSLFIGNTRVASSDFSVGVAIGTAGSAPYTDANVSYFRGEIDEVRIYSRALSATEIQALF